jgi:hypothetical protein
MSYSGSITTEKWTIKSENVANSNPLGKRRMYLYVGVNRGVIIGLSL